MEAIKLTYVIDAFLIMGLTIVSSIFNIREVSRKKCEDRTTMRNYMYLALSVLVWTFASNIIFYFRERIGMEFYSYGNWDRLPYMMIGSATILAVFVFFTALNIDLTRNDTNRFLSVCKNLNVAGLDKSGISKKSTASEVKDMFSFKSRLDNMHAKWSVDKKPKMTRNDVDEWNALSAYHNSVEDFFNRINESFGGLQSSFKHEWDLINHETYKNEAKNWLKDMNTYPDDIEAYKEVALLTDMYKSAGCQELRFYDLVKSSTNVDELTVANLKDMHNKFKTNEAELYSDSLKKEVDETFLTSFKDFIKTLKPTSGSGGDTTDSFTGKYVGTDNDFLQLGGKTCTSVNNEETRNKIFKHTLHIEQIKTMVKDIRSKYNMLKTVFNTAALSAYEADVKLQDDYLRRRIISGFVWCMVLWPSLQYHFFNARMYTAFGTDTNQYAFYVLGVAMPVILGVGIFGGKDARKQLNIKNIQKVIKEIQNAKL